MPRYISYAQDKESILDIIIKNLRFKTIISEIKLNTTVVDLGCGYQGELLRLISDKIKKGIGIDLSITNEATLPNISLIKADSNFKIPLKNNYADVVVALATIEHLDKPQNLLREAYRILKKNGLLIITTPSPKSKLLLEFMAYKLKIINQQEIADHKRYYSSPDLLKDIIGAGFSKDKVNIKYFQFGFNQLAKAIK